MLRSGLLRVTAQPNRDFGVRPITIARERRLSGGSPEEPKGRIGEPTNPTLTNLKSPIALDLNRVITMAHAAAASAVSRRIVSSAAFTKKAEREST
jgi:hypothetical protein